MKLKTLLTLIFVVFVETAYGQNLEQVSVAHANKLNIESQILERGLRVSANPVVRSKFCPAPEHAVSTTVGTITCRIDDLSYVGGLGSLATADASSRTSLNALRVYHAWAINTKIDTQAAGWQVRAGSHAANVALANFRITNGVKWQVKCLIYFRLRNPVNIVQLDVNDKFAQKLIYRQGPYNVVVVEWDTPTKKWKVSRVLTRADGTIDKGVEMVDPSGDEYFTRTFYGYRVVTRNENFQNSVQLNWALNEDWITKYGLDIEQTGVGDVVEDITTQGRGYVTIKTMTAVQ